MTPEPNPPSPPAQPPGTLLNIAESDRNRLSEALQSLLAHGSILGLDPGQAELYSWSRQNFAWLRELASLTGLTVAIEHESRLIQAIPEKASITLHLRQDATIVLLALWYEFDTQVRDQGAAQARLTVEQLNQLLKEKLLPDLKSQPSAGRLHEILRLAHRYNLIRFDPAVPFEQSRIEILKTLPRVLQFNDIADWTKTAQLHKDPSPSPSTADLEVESES